MNSKVKFFQQGDVLLVPVDSIPEDAKIKKDMVVAEGEVTGHYHRVSGNAAVLEKGGSLFVDAKESADVTHEEHGKITTPPGKYEVRIVREYDPLEDEIRSVRD